MEAEKAAGLTRVSDELLPDVRQVAYTQLAIGLLWSELARDIIELETDRLSIIADAGIRTLSPRHTVPCAQSGRPSVSWMPWQRSSRMLPLSHTSSVSTTENASDVQTLWGRLPRRPFLLHH